MPPAKRRQAETLHEQRRKAEQEPGELGREANQTPKNGEFWFF
jgi:hypothetical protein